MVGEVEEAGREEGVAELGEEVRGGGLGGMGRGKGDERDGAGAGRGGCCRGGCR